MLDLANVVPVKEEEVEEEEEEEEDAGEGRCLCVREAHLGLWLCF